jgi:acyl carrier protein
MKIEEKIRDFILKNLYFAEDFELGEDHSFLNEGIIDSMGAMELVAFVESEFGIKVDMGEVVVKNFDSIRQLANFVRGKLSAANQTVASAWAPEIAPVRETALSFIAPQSSTPSAKTN